MMNSQGSYGREEIDNFRGVISNILTPGRYEKYQRKWEYEMPGGLLPNQQENKDIDTLYPTLFKTLGSTKIDNLCPNNSISLGGLCLLFTGDIRTLGEGYLPDEERTKINSLKDVTNWIDKYLPRADQILDSIGPTRIKNNVVVFEDNIFAKLLTNLLKLDPGERKIIQKSFRSLGEKSESIIENFLRKYSGEGVKLIPVYASDIEESLAKYVSMFSGVVGYLQFEKQEKAAVELMYTYMWPKLLKENGYIDDDRNCVIVEPFTHFIDSFNNSSLEYSQRLEQYFRSNPLGKEGENKNISGIGFVPTIRLMRGNGKSPFSRETACPETLNMSNWKKILKNAQNDIYKPLPSSENIILRAGVNMLYGNESGRNTIVEFSELEKRFRKEKNESKKSGCTDLAGMKKYYSDQARPLLESVLSNTEEICCELFSGDG